LADLDTELLGNHTVAEFVNQDAAEQRK